ncbi:MAG: sugar transferase [Bacteroides sp.]|nr:sugar transferase [Bacteroides sp.]
MKEGLSVNAAQQRLRYIMSDMLTGFVAFFIFNIVRFFLLNGNQPAEFMWEYVLSGKLIIETVVVPVGMLGIYWLSGYYNLPFGKSRLQEFLVTFSSSVVNTALIYLVLLINDQTGRRTVNYELILSLLGLLFIFCYIGRIIITSFALRHFKAHQWGFRALVIGATPRARATARRLVEGPSRVGYTIVGFVTIPGEENDSVVGGDVYSMDEVERVCHDNKIDQLIIAQKSYDENKVLNLLYHLFSLGIPIKIMPDTFSFITSGIRLQDIYGEPFIDLTTPSISEASKNIKRTIDVVASLLMLIILSPVYAWLAVMVKSDSKGPVFYRQERIGLRQVPFYIYKFRSMRVDAEKDGPRLSSDDDSRVTRVGKILRKYRLDELPQFWNVLKGDMSLVGPRPERAYYIAKIMERAPYYALLYQVRPGITSWGMVKYGYASTVDQMVERTRFDLIYLSNMSLFVDFKIMIYTVNTVVRGRGV